MKVLIKEKLSPHKSKTPEGYLICRDAILGRLGEQDYYASEIYPNWDGKDKIIKVIRRPEQVFSKETLASFENKPITCEHPDEDVNPENFSEYSVGFARDIHKATVNGEDVMVGNLIITDSDIINDIENGIRTELSCGYNCDITDGDHPEQINIRGNHIALCEKGRAGNAKIIDSDPEPRVNGYLKQIEDLAFEARSRVENAEDREKELLDVYARLETLVHNSQGDRQQIAVDMANGTIDRLKKTYHLKGHGLTSFKVGDSATGKLPVRMRRVVAGMLDKVSGFTGQDLYIEDIINPIEKATGLNLIRDKIEGWYKTGDGIMRKDYFFHPDGYSDQFMISLYAPNNYEVNEVNGYFLTDSVKDAVNYLIEDGHGKFLTNGFAWSSDKKDARYFATSEEAEEFIKKYNISTGRIMVEDKLIQSSSKEALKKNIAAEIKAGKDPKQAAAIAYSVQRKNDASPEKFDSYSLYVGFGTLHYDKDGNLQARSTSDVTKKVIENLQLSKTYPTEEGARKAGEKIIQFYKGMFDGKYNDITVVISGNKGRAGWKVDELYSKDFQDSVEDDFRGEIIDTEEAEFDYYRGYDITQNAEGYYIVELDNGQVLVESLEAAQELIDDFLEKTENMIRDHAIKEKVHDSKFPEFEAEIRKEMIRQKRAVEKDTAPDDDNARLPFRKTKNKLLKILKEQLEKERGV